ncbi:MAG: four helix bundle protein [Flavisolibacter sp.]|jgi:four helix bundle protein
MFLKLAHTKLGVFQTARIFVLECYEVVKTFPAEERLGVTQQIRRAALSVYLNIAEGCSRKSHAERKKFFEISRGSVIETDAALDIAIELNFCSEEQLQFLGENLIKTFKLLCGLIGKEATHH